MALGEKSEDERSLRDDLAAGLKEIEEREASEATAAPEGDDASAPQAEAKVEPAETQTDRGDGRDAHGRFISKPKDGVESHAPEDASQKAAASSSETLPGSSDQSSQPEAGSTQVATEDAPPKSWRADEASAWKDLPATAKAAIVRREAEAARLAGANDSERMFGREIAEVFRPHMEVINSFGVSPQIALRGLLENDRILRSGTPEEKLAKARQLVADYGLDISQVADTSHLPSDPHVLSLQQKINQLEQRLATPQNQQFAPLPLSPEDSNVQSEIEAFRADPAHPHFDAVRLVMGQLLETGAAPDLESAYQAAVTLSPALRSTATPVAAANSAEKTAAARRASASVASSPGPTGNPVAMSLRDELREQMRSAGFSV